MTLTPMWSKKSEQTLRFLWSDGGGQAPREWVTPQHAKKRVCNGGLSGPSR
jgi:hypothetical protein